jgi:signal transduction histidine kinase
LNATIQDLRGFIFGLRPELVDRTDLVGLLVALTEQLHQNSLVAVDVDLAEDLVEPSAHVRAELLQIAREALSNVARHARATKATVRLAPEGDELVLEIRDNGQGFEPTVTPPGDHFGLANMRDRATALHGNLLVESGGASGTRIIVRIPTADHRRGRSADD